MPRLLPALLLLLATTAAAAELRDMKQPDRISSAFPAAAKLRVMNVWATWCVPCVAEMPELRAIDETFGPEVAMLGVSLDDMIPGAKRESVITFLDKQKIAYPNIYYTGNADDLGDRIKFDGEIPITIVYDRNGKELWRHQGAIDRKQTIAELRKLLRR
ncbi:MAG TPA: TlpA disulfide reductase family protein [Thermoanaerobaculia bacterium]|jgi:thiol-disulfide isomerase/thioredoxin|nr:TlpA disulfide reductase family protein [Thermoanaerobaculia bacterium]